VSIIKSNLLLLLAAAIWGFAFVAQKVGMEHVGPFTYNGVRFFLGSMSLIPVMFIFRGEGHSPLAGFRPALVPGLLAGVILFAGISLQQVGLIYTTAGKAAFITGLYLVLVPVAGVFLGQVVGRGTWVGCALAVVGMYFLCVRETTRLEYGDFLVLIGALFWTMHILVIGYFSRRVDVLKLSCLQFLTCSVISLMIAAITETVLVKELLAGIVPILYGGFCSVGIAYTLQVVGQKYAPPAHAAIILSLETVFAVIGGRVLLAERMGWPEVFGCGLMLAGMLVSQLQNMRQEKIESASLN